MAIAGIGVGELELAALGPGGSSGHWAQRLKVYRSAGAVETNQFVRRVAEGGSAHTAALGSQLEQELVRDRLWLFDYHHVCWGEKAPDDLEAPPKRAAIAQFQRKAVLVSRELLKAARKHEDGLPASDANSILHLEASVHTPDLTLASVD